MTVEEKLQTEEKLQKPVLRRTDRTLPIALLRARETLMIPVREKLLQSRISEQKWRVLRVVEESGPIKQSDIAQKACLHLPSLTRIMHALNRDELLTRSGDEQDMSQSVAVITDAGRELIFEQIALNQDLFERLESQFGTEKMDMLLDLLDEIQQLQL